MAKKPRKQSSSFSMANQLHRSDKKERAQSLANQAIITLLLSVAAFWWETMTYWFLTILVVYSVYRLFVAVKMMGDIIKEEKAERTLL